MLLKIPKLFFKICWTIIALSIASLAFLIFLFPTILLFKLPLALRVKVISYPWSYFSKILINICFLAKVQVRDMRTKEMKSKFLPQELFICNHQSITDIPLNLSYYQIPFVMKKEILKIPLFGLVGRVSGSIPVDRGDKNSRRRTIEIAHQQLVEQKVGLHYYPEGTRNKVSFAPKPLESIKTTLMEIAYKQKIPVIPVSIDGCNRLINKKGIIQPFQKLAMIIHSPIYPEEFSSAEEFISHCWQKVIDGYVEINQGCIQ